MTGKGQSLPELMRAEEKIKAAIKARTAEDDKKRAEREKKRLKGGNVLVPASPAKDNKRNVDQWSRDDPIRSTSPGHKLNARLGRFEPPKDKGPSPTFYHPPAARPSSFLALTAASSSSCSTSALPEIERSSSFASRPATLPPLPVPSRKGKERARVEEEAEEEEILARSRSTESRRGERREDLTVIEKMEMGPKEFGNGPGGDGKWETVEPNSGIRLTKRTLAHDLLQSHLSDRFHVPPSILYSIIRLSRDGTFYDIPLSGDWITIAVVAEQNGGVRTTKGGPAIGNEASDDDELDEPSISSLSATASGKGQQQTASKKKSASKKKGGPRKFVSFKLVSLPTRSSGQTASQGDASLTMLLFEADSCTKGVGGKKIYKGGSRGAYEKFWNVRIGTVIAVLNPRVLRPLKNAQAPHPLTNALAINPESAESITEIGWSRDLGTCSAIKLDGNRCSNWIDKRTSEVCEFHIHSAIKKQRAGRAEFGSSTSTMALGVRQNRPNAKSQGLTAYSRSASASSSTTYDPITKTGLLPRDTIATLPGSTFPSYRKNPLTNNASDSATYVVNGHTIRPHGQASAGKFGFGSEHVDEKMGRGKVEARKRKREMEESEAFLRQNLGKGGGAGVGDGTEGGKNLEAARREMEKRRREREAGAKDGQGKGRGKRRGGDGDEDELDEEEERKKREEEAARIVRRKSAFSAEAIRRIGFNPCVKDGKVEETEETKRQRKAAIALIAADLSSIPTLLGPVPGPKHRTSVLAPSEPPSSASPAPPSSRPQNANASSSSTGKERLLSLDDDDDGSSDLEIEGAPSSSRVVLPGAIGAKDGGGGSGPAKRKVVLDRAGVWGTGAGSGKGVGGSRSGSEAATRDPDEDEDEEDGRVGRGKRRSLGGGGFFGSCSRVIDDDDEEEDDEAGYARAAGHE